MVISRQDTQTESRSWIALLGSGLALALYLWATWSDGVGITPDSANHLATAETLVRERVWVSYDLEPYIWWPPLFTVLLAIPTALGASVATSSWLLNSAALVGIVLCSWRLLELHVDSPVGVIGGVMAIAVAYPLHYIAGKAWSEPTFVFLAVASVLALSRYVEEDTVKRLLVAAVLISLAALQRSTGVALAVVGGLTVLLAVSDQSIPLRIRRAALFSVVIMAPTALWVVRTVAVSGTVLGVRGASLYSFSENVVQALTVSVGWFMPGRLTALPVASLLVLGLVGVVIAIISSRVREQGLTALPTRVLLPILLYPPAHLALTLYASSTVALDQLETRYLSPLLPFIVLWVLMSTEWVGKKVGTRLPSPVWGTALVALAVGVLGFKPAVQTVQQANGTRGDLHRDFSAPRWADSETMDYLRTVVPPRLMFSNRPDAVYIQTGIHTSHSPREMLYNSPDVGDDDLTDRLEAAIARDGFAWLAWFERAGNGFLYPVETLGEMYDLESVAAYEDGAVYRVRMREGA